MSRETTFNTFTVELGGLPLNLAACYEFRAITPTWKSLGRLPYLGNSPNQRDLFEDWEDATPRYYERLYFEAMGGDTDVPLDTILIQQSSTLVSFFATQLIDVPACFDKVLYAHSSLADKPKLRIVTMLMRRGNRLKVSKLFALSTLNLSAKRAASTHEMGWRFLFTMFNQLSAINLGQLTVPLNISCFPPETEFLDKYAQVSTRTDQLVSDDDQFSELLFDEILTYLPSFSFFIKRVDKLKHRHSRGKSGKYEIIWKYIPHYKRLLVVLRWLMRDVRFQTPKTFQQRIERSLEALLLRKPDHLVCKSRRFVHKFVFQKHRKTLLKTLRLP